MRKSNSQRERTIRSTLATLCACAIVIGVPILSVRQYSHFINIDHRNSTPLAPLQVRTQDKSQTPYQLFKEPLISVTFDDGWEVTYADAMPLLQKYGIRTTQYVLSGVEKDQKYLSWKQIQAIHNAGHEIGCHSETHPDLRLLDDKDLTQQVHGCKVELSKQIGTVSSFASPYGAADQRTLAKISTDFSSQRNTNGDSSNGVTEDDVNLEDGFNPLNIIGMTIKHDTSITEIKNLINYTTAHNGWLVLTYHQADDGSTKYGIDAADLEAQLRLINQAPARVVTIDQVIRSRSQTK